MSSDAQDLIELLKEIFGSEDNETKDKEKEDPKLTESSELIALMKEVFTTQESQ